MILFTTGKLKVIGGLVEDNTAPGAAGVASSGLSVFIASGVEFRKNTAKFGGAIYLENYSVVNIIGCTFIVSRPDFSGPQFQFTKGHYFLLNMN